MNPDSSLRMKERPILFSGPMVRAILEGRKTQTRRIVKPQPVCFSHADWPESPDFVPHFNPDGSLCCGVCMGQEQRLTAKDVTGIRNPYGRPGDRLWVKETWRTVRSLDHCKPTSLAEGSPIQFEADLWNPGFGMLDPGKTRVSLFMRRWMSRITLEIESVRVERLQDISEEDAKAEGIDPASRFETGSGEVFTFAECYNLLWNSINGPGSWDLNPWVWVVEFKRITP